MSLIVLSLYLYLGFRGRLAAKKVNIHTNFEKSAARLQQLRLLIIVALVFMMSGVSVETAQAASQKAQVNSLKLGQQSKPAKRKLRRSTRTSHRVQAAKPGVQAAHTASSKVQAASEKTKKVVDKVQTSLDKTEVSDTATDIIQAEAEKEQEVRELVEAANGKDDSIETKRLTTLAEELKRKSANTPVSNDKTESAAKAPNKAETQSIDTKSKDAERVSRKIALVLGGGGARGAAHIGVLRVLEENNLKPDLIVGNSMGSVIGALYCAGVPLDRIEKLCVDGEVKKAFAPFPIAVQVMKKAARLKIPFVRIKRYPGLYNGDSLESFINKTVGAEHTKIESLEIPMVITVVNLLDGKAYRMTKGDLGKIVRASCSLPPIVKPVEYEGMLLADGGIRTNLPTMTARDIGVDVVIAVNVDETLDSVTKRDMQKLTLLANRVTSIMLAVRDEQFAKVADLVIHPDVSGISIISVNDEDYPVAIEAGRVAATEALPKLKQLFGSQTAIKPTDPAQSIH